MSLKSHYGHQRVLLFSYGSLQQIAIKIFNLVYFALWKTTK